MHCVKWASGCYIQLRSTPEISSVQYTIVAGLYEDEHRTLCIRAGTQRSTSIEP